MKNQLTKPNRTALLSAIDSGFGFAFRSYETVYLFRSQSALTRFVNGWKKQHGSNSDGEPNKCGAYGHLTYRNTAYYQ